uniref:EOG090X0O5J n=1 Tax=Evadne anonyx TaxID=141404 RepID=A0A9N6WY59_9CRUS|nr:EOG090X0O5J [Evadne anonyx]
MALYKLMQGSLSRICQFNQKSTAIASTTVTRGMKNSNQSFFETEESTPEPVSATVTREKTINSVTLLGRLGSAPQKRGTEAHPVVVMSLATHINMTNSQGEVNQKTEWHRICVFKPHLRETAFNYAAKGNRVMVQGRLLYGEVTDSNGGTQNTVSIVADDIIYFKNS